MDPITEWSGIIEQCLIRAMLRLSFECDRWNTTCWNKGSSAASGHGKASDVSKAAMLHRGADYIRQLRLERQQQQQEMEELKNTIESLNAAIRSAPYPPPTSVKSSGRIGETRRSSVDYGKKLLSFWFGYPWLNFVVSMDES